MTATELAKPAAITREDRERIFALWAKAREARGRFMEYFSAERERIESIGGMRSWGEHIESVLHAGSDPQYNALHDAESRADEVLRAYVKESLPRYPWLDTSWLRSWFCGFNAPDDAGMTEKIDSAYRDAVRRWFAEIHRDELGTMRDELLASAIVYDVESLTIGEVYHCASDEALYKITRRTHGGKRTMAQRYDESDGEMRIRSFAPPKAYDYSPKGYRRVTPEWASRHEALRQAFLAEQEITR